MKRAVLVLAILGSGYAGKLAPAKVKVFIVPQTGGFDSYIAAAIVKKNAPIIVTAKEADAEYILTSTLTSKEESGLGKVARCAFMYCIGIDGQQTVTVKLMKRNQEMAWAYNVRKLGAHNYQSSAEAIAKHLKTFLLKNNQ